MDANDSTFGFREVEQKAFDESCCAFANSENMTQIAKQIGMNPVILRNKLNPGNERHKLTAVELVKISGIYRITCYLCSVSVSWA